MAKGEVQIARGSNESLETKIAAPDKWASASHISSETAITRPQAGRSDCFNKKEVVYFFFGYHNQGSCSGHGLVTEAKDKPKRLLAQFQGLINCVTRRVCLPANRITVVRNRICGSVYLRSVAKVRS